MNLNKSISCHVCNSKNFIAKHEAKYIYTYKINIPDSNNLLNESENLPFLFDKRDKASSSQYIECEQCKTQYPCSFEMNTDEIEFTILQKAIRSDHKTKPDFYG